MAEEKGLRPIVDRPNKAIETFEEVWEKAQTGDLLLVSGAQELDSSMASAIKMATRSPFSHIGIIVRDPTKEMWDTYGRLRADLGENPNGEPGAWGEGEEVPRNRQVYLFDSDYEEDGTVDGPTLRPLQEVVSAYLLDDYHGTDGDIVIRRLQCDDAKRAEVLQKFGEFANSVAGRCFEAKSMTDGKFLQMLMSVWGGNPSEDLTRLFCSELTAAAYKSAGLIHADAGNATNYQPAHFAENKLTELEGDASLGPEIVMDLNALLYEIKVRVVRCDGLEEASRLQAFFDPMDPYCKVLLAGRKRYKTESITNTTAPEWNEEVTILYDGVSPMEFEILDANNINKDQFLGQGKLDSASFVKKGFKGTVPIQQESGAEDAQLKVEVQILRACHGPFCSSGSGGGDDDDDKKRKKAKAKKEKRDEDKKEKRKDKKEKDDKKDKKEKDDKKDKKENKSKGGYVGGDD